jgi:hypothetical protein
MQWKATNTSSNKGQLVDEHLIMRHFGLAVPSQFAESFTGNTVFDDIELLIAAYPDFGNQPTTPKGCDGKLTSPQVDTAS